MKRCYLTALLSLFVSIEPLAGPCLSTSKHWPNIVCQPWPLACCYAASFTQECVCVRAGRDRQWAEAKQKPAVSPTPWSTISLNEFPLSVSDSSPSRLLGFIVCEEREWPQPPLTPKDKSLKSHPTPSYILYREEKSSESSTFFLFQLFGCPFLKIQIVCPNVSNVVCTCVKNYVYLFTHLNCNFQFWVF